MSKAKLERADNWLSKAFPPHDPPQRDILNEIEPVHTVDSGSFEEVGYTIHSTEGDLSAEPLQRTARKFRTRTSATRPRKKTAIKKAVKKEDRATRANRILRNYLARQKFIKLQPNYHVIVLEYLERHIKEFPFINASFVKELRQNVFGKVKIITASRHIDISAGREKPESYQCLVMVPINFVTALQSTKFYRDTLTALLVHEIEGHCRDFNPRSAFWRTMRGAELVNPAVRASELGWQDTVRPYLELSALIENVDFMMTKLHFAKKPRAIVKSFRETLPKLVGEDASSALMGLSFLDRKKRELVAGFFKERMGRASKETRDYFRKILQEDYNFNDKFISQIGL